MGKRRSSKSDAPTRTAGPDAPSTPAPVVADPARPTPAASIPERHGPAAPPVRPRGLARLRALLKLTDATPDDDVIEEACSRIESLQERADSRPVEWSRSWRR